MWEETEYPTGTHLFGDLTCSEKWVYYHSVSQHTNYQKFHSHQLVEDYEKDSKDLHVHKAF